MIATRKILGARLTAWALVSFLAACNFFNPSGEGDAGDDPDAQLALGENYFREQDYAAAMDVFSRVIAADSGNTMAYYGYAKSVLRYERVNVSTLLAETEKSREEKTVPFTNADDATLTRYLQSASKAKNALAMLTERDTLTRWFRYGGDSLSRQALADPLRIPRIRFMEEYWNLAEQGVSGFRPKSSFPLSDQKLSYEKIIADLGYLELIYASGHLRDLDANDTIDARDAMLKKLVFSTDGGFKVENLQSISQDLQDPGNRENMNNLVLSVADGMASTQTVLALLSSPSVSDTAGELAGSVTQNLDSVIADMGDNISFYQFGDGRDNDGDGCDDEEILDGKDNDGDGLTDEDARVALLDGVDNNHDGIRDLADDREQVDGNGALKFTAAAAFVKGNAYRDRAFKAGVQKDSLTVRTGLNAAQQASLESAKASIGGCWNNY